MKQVVLPQGLSIHEEQTHKDPWHQFEGLVFILIGIHVAAFAFWCYLLYKSKRNAKDSSAKPADSSSDWRTPKDILRAYHKAQIGKS